MDYQTVALIAAGLGWLITVFVTGYWRARYHAMRRDWIAERHYRNQDRAAADATVRETDARQGAPQERTRRPDDRQGDEMTRCSYCGYDNGRHHPNCPARPVVHEMVNRLGPSCPNPECRHPLCVAIRAAREAEDRAERSEARAEAVQLAPVAKAIFRAARDYPSAIKLEELPFAVRRIYFDMAQAAVQAIEEQKS